MLQLKFQSIKEVKPGSKWQNLFNTHWDAYRNWFQSKGAFESTGLKESQQALKKYMPQFYDTYLKLCKLAGDSDKAKRFLSGYNPPAYISGCSQLVYEENPMLIRNYDYHPHLSEGTLLMSKWHDKEVIATGDCLWGAVDGMNDDGIAISLTFGGRKEVGAGFGIPFIIRYALEFSSTIDEAIKILSEIPSHMSYNVAVMDKKGNHKIVMLAPDKAPKTLEGSVSTNHQELIDWKEHAVFSKTLEREQFLQNLLQQDKLSRQEIIDAFLNTPLFSKRYSEGFGTVYTASYFPSEGRMQLHWKDEKLEQSFKAFKETATLISFTSAEKNYETPKYERPETPASETSEYNWKDYASYSSENFSATSISILLDNMKYVPGFDSEVLRDKLKAIGGTEKKRGEIPWEMIADFWKEFGKSFIG